MRSMVGVAGSLLEMVQCSRCAVLEWSEDVLQTVHGAGRGLLCAHQDAAVSALLAAIGANDLVAARAAYRECQRLHIQHIDEYTFTALQSSTLPLSAVYGEDTHKFVGTLRPDGTYGVIRDGVRPVDVCACGAQFPGINPRSRVYDVRPSLADHVQATSEGATE